MKRKWMALLLPVRMVLVAVLLFVLWQAWVFMRPRPHEFTAAEVKALRAACGKVADACESKAEKPARFGVAHLANDPTDVATTVLRDTLAGRKGWSVQAGSPIQKFLRDISHAVGEATSLDEILHAGRRVELDVVVAGRVLAVESTNGTAQAALQIYAYDVRPGTWLVKETVTAEFNPSLAEKAVDRVRTARPVTKLLLWLVVVLVLPWGTAFATRWALVERSNLASFVVVGVYTLLDLLLAVALAGFTVVGTLQWVKLLLALACGGAYNYWACEKIAGREA